MTRHSTSLPTSVTVFLLFAGLSILSSSSLGSSAMSASTASSASMSSLHSLSDDETHVRPDKNSYRIAVSIFWLVLFLFFGWFSLSTLFVRERFFC